MTDSLLLSVFVFAALAFVIHVYDKIDFGFLSKGHEIKLSSKSLIFIFSFVILLGVFGTWLILSDGGTDLLQYFYIATFAVGSFLSWILIFPKSRRNTLLGILVIAIFILLILTTQSQLLQNIFMAFSILWVGPAVFKKLKIRRTYFLIFLAIFLFIDIYNVYIAHPLVSSSEINFLLNGYVLFGNFALGIGDFFLAYLAINSVQKDTSKTAAIIVAFCIAFARLVLPAFLANQYGDVPYSIIIVFFTVLAYLSIFVFAHFSRLKKTLIN